MREQVRGYDTQFLKRVSMAALNAPVQRLVDICIKRDIPISHVAVKLGVTRATVYNWFKGVTSPRSAHLPNIEQIAKELIKRSK